MKHPVAFKRLRLFNPGAFVERVIAHLHPDNIDEMLRGYYLEREVINEYGRLNLFLAVMPSSFVGSQYFGGLLSQETSNR